MYIFVRIFIFIFINYSALVKTSRGNELEDIFGFGAEDDEENILQTFSDMENSITAAAVDNIIKSTRQDQEDVELFLNHGPMIAPDIVLKGYVDSRVSLSTVDDILQIHHGKKPNLNDVMGNGIADTEPLAFDDIRTFEHTSSNFSSEQYYPLSNSLSTSAEQGDNRPCHKNFHGSYGGFDLSFQKDCLIEISNPNDEARLILTCSPIALGDCSTHKDSLSVNVMGDTTFKQNSFLYCGKDANIRAISFQNKLAIRIKKTDIIPGSTFCTYHSRKYTREYSSSPSAVSCGRLGRLGKIVGGRRVPPGLFPWAAQLDITRTDGTQTGCTGTIISPQYILTAAHCMKRAESVSAFMGGTDRQDIIGTEVLIQAEKYILHKKWSSRTLVADIALVKLTQPIQYSDDISPICLPEGKLLSEDLSGKRGVAIGWGRTETKKKAPKRLYRIKLPLLSDSNCKNIYRRFYIPKVMMCTDSKKDAAICYGMTRNSNNYAG